MKASKIIISGFIAILIYQSSFGQVPQGFKYQAVCRDNTGALIQNQSVDIRLSVHDLDPLGSIIYQETFTLVSNQFGLIMADVGKGNVQTGNFASIPWETGDKFLEMELDLGSGFSSMGTTQFLSVPYALHAETAENLVGGITETDPEVGLNTSNYLSKWNGISLISSSIFDNGNIGIGTENASKKLTIAGNAQVQADGDWYPGATARLYLGPDDNMWIEHVHSGGLNLEVCNGWPFYIRNGGNVTLAVDGSGNVGIGTMYPSAKLDVWNGNITVSNGAVISNYGFFGDALRTNWGNDLTLQSSYEDKGIIFTTFSGEKMRIDATGNVGIGNSNPSYKLDVVGDINSAGTLYANSGIITATYSPAVLDVNGIGNSSHIRLFSGQDNSQIFLSDYQGVMGIQLWHTGKAYFAGNVGVGTNSPSSILHLNGDSPKLKIQTKTNLTDPSLEFIKYGVRTMEIKLMDGGAGTGLQFIDQNSEQVRMYIKASTGNVGIGTIFPAATLDVNGQVKIAGGSPGAGKVLTSDASGLATWESPESTGAHYIGEAYGGGIVFYVYDNGQHGLIAATSDQSEGIQWSNGLYRYTGTTGDGMGAGVMNTSMIVATQMGDNETGNFAAKVCTDYSVMANGIVYGDWYLPSKYESDLLYLQKDIIGGFADADYWTSTEEPWANSFAKHKYFGNGAQTFPSDVKYHAFRVRAIRAF